MQAILRSFYSTAVVNFFTWNKAYALFALPTFVHHKGYLLKPVDDYLSHLLEKYCRRGWRFQETMWPEEMTSDQPIQTTRRVGDEFTWIIPFDTSCVNWSNTPDSVLEYSNFKVIQLSESRRNYEVSAHLFKSEVLRHQYLYGDLSQMENRRSWMMFLGERVDALTVLELYKLAPEARPERFSDFPENRSSMQNCMRNRPKPDSWTYWDDEIPKWYHAWRQLESESKKIC